MAATARAIILSRVTNLSRNPIHSTKPPPPRPLFPPLATAGKRCRLATSASTISCLGGGVSDDFISTRKSTFDQGFTVIANMLKRIEPLDTSVISKGVSDSAKDSMKQTISTMLGLLPSDQFSVTVEFSKRPLHRLLVSSIITGYTLWNAEYRISLMRNLHISPNSLKTLNCLEQIEVEVEVSEDKGSEHRNFEGGFDLEYDDFERSPQIFGDLSPEALKYIQQLQSDLSNVKEELNVQTKENMQIESGRENKNNLLEYLRSLDVDMVTELSLPSSAEVEDIIHQSVRNILRRFFQDDASSDFIEAITDNYPDRGDEFCDTVTTSRDYLAKLLFWCMLLGHHLRGLENRLQLSCVVGLL
ncbi:Seed maturation-like protein [Quillaja saponaria]|uniref:Seed maturation-like protein n=1 Tax=Quillaja saponaria TaxID=32244 RepID=A0AAD7VBJ2_QUISA|nr:Seed maturation-like protein [Quillaja saponaria]KAJ7970911.1 Seed maturation-like protein [Quillaja saponaria]